jgi:transcriptional regulator with XRE-family HTH domain
MTASAGIPELVARTVRAVRTAHGMSPQGLAARAGIGLDVLTALEEGTGNPQLETLIQVSDALMIPLARLVEGEPEPTLRMFPPERQPVLWHGPKGGTGTLLVGSDPRPALEMWNWRLEPGEIRLGAPHLPGNREIAYVTQGVLTLTIDGCRYLLEQGTAAVFVGDRPHSYANEQDTPLHYTVALTDP